MSTKFERALELMDEMYKKKNADYSNGGEFDNFEIVSTATGLSPDYAFLVQIANKVARLNSLLAQNREPNNESLQDTRFDLAVYATMLFAYFLD